MLRIAGLLMRFVFTAAILSSVVAATGRIMVGGSTCYYCAGFRVSRQMILCLLGWFYYFLS